MVRDLCSKRTAADKIMNKMNENRKIVLDTLNEQNIEYEMFEHQAVYTCLLYTSGMSAELTEKKVYL